MALYPSRQMERFELRQDLKVVGEEAEARERWKRWLRGWMVLRAQRLGGWFPVAADD